MTFIETAPPEHASPALAKLYKSDREVAADATSVTEEGIDRLRNLGLRDALTVGRPIAER